MASKKKVTGVRSAFVTVGKGSDAQEVVVHHGEPLPDGISADEVKRLDGLGVFGPTPRHLLPFDQRPPIDPNGAKSTAGSARQVDTSALEADNSRLEAELAEANAKLLDAARLAPVVAGTVEDITKHLTEHPEDRDAIVFLEANGQARDGVLKLGS